MSPRALVTGGAGFVGSNLCWELAARGWQVVALDDFSAGTFENLRGFPGDVVAADFGNTDYWSKRVGKIDAVFHQAAISDTTVMDQALMMKVSQSQFLLLDAAVLISTYSTAWAITLVCQSIYLT